jgi:hypothetical protein
MLATVGDHLYDASGRRDRDDFRSMNYYFSSSDNGSGGKTK